MNSTLPLIVASLLACSGGEPAPPTDEAARAVAPEPSFDVQTYGWVSQTVLEPSQFGALVEGADRLGWVAMHAHDYRGAAEAFEGTIGKGRAAFALALLFDDLASVSGLAHEQLFTEWDERSELPPGNEPALVASLASYCSEGSTTVTWAQKISEGPGLDIAQVLMQNRSPFDVQSADPFGRRLAVHRAALDNDEAKILAAAAEPVIERPESGGFVRKFWDPCVFHTLSRVWMARVFRHVKGSSWQQISYWATPEAGLGGLIFAPWARPRDLVSEAATADRPGLVGARSSLLRDHAIGTDAIASDDPEEARALVRLLDQTLGRWEAQLEDLADDDGTALLQDLALIRRFRQEWLVTRARLALYNDRPHQALTYLELGRVPSEKVGAAIPPALMAVLAQAQLRLGRVREALDSLRALADLHPEILGLTEVVGDLAVLRGLDRHGDSKETQ